MRTKQPEFVRPASPAIRLSVMTRLRLPRCLQWTTFSFTPSLTAILFGSEQGHAHPSEFLKLDYVLNAYLFEVLGRTSGSHSDPICFRKLSKLNLSFLCLFCWSMISFTSHTTRYSRRHSHHPAPRPPGATRKESDHVVFFFAAMALMRYVLVSLCRTCLWQPLLLSAR